MTRKERSVISPYSSDVFMRLLTVSIIFLVHIRAALVYNIQEHVVHLAILNLRLTDIYGIKLLETIPDAIKATSIGAADFLEKQYLGEQLPLRIGQLYRVGLLDRENPCLRRENLKPNPRIRVYD